MVRPGAIGVLVLAPLLLHVALRPRGRYALGMSAGAAVVGVAAPLVVIALFAAADLLAGWR